MIRVMVADDSAIVRAMLGQVLGDDSRFQVVGMAENGKLAVNMAQELTPDLIIMDINMPVINGIEAIHKIRMTMNPTIVAFTTEDTKESYESCLDSGATDVVQKPNLATMSMEKIREFCNELVEIHEAYTLNSIHFKRRSAPAFQRSTDREVIQATDKYEQCKKTAKYSVVAIGASTGGPVAIQKLLVGIGKNFPLPIIITQHIDEIFDIQFSQWLAKTTGLDVCTAKDRQVLEGGKVYVAPAGKHLCLTRLSTKKSSLMLDDSEQIHFLKPAVDKMFKSCADTLGQETIAILLTGMGTDGAEGMKEIYDAGGFTIAQSEKSCVVFGMPKAAIERNAVSAIENLDNIPGLLKQLAGDRNELA